MYSGEVGSKMTFKLGSCVSGISSDGVDGVECQDAAMLGYVLGCLGHSLRESIYCMYLFCTTILPHQPSAVAAPFLAMHTLTEQ